MKPVFFLLLSLLFSGCLFAADLTNEFKALDEASSAAVVKRELNKIIEKLETVKVHDPGQPLESMKALFDFQMQLQNKFMPKWEKQGVLGEVIGEYNGALRSIRYVSEMYGEAHLKDKPLSKDEPVFTNNTDQGLVTLGWDPQSNEVQLDANARKEFKAGTVYLIRGTSEISAAIARVTENTDGQFSHIAMSHRLEGSDTEGSGELVFIESLIETGTQQKKPETMFDDPGVPRFQVYNYNDKESSLPGLASQNMYDFVTSNDFDPQYDVSMTVSGEGDVASRREGMFCSEVVFEGYYEASDNKVKIPRHPSAIKHTLFTRALGITAEETFAPSDIQSDDRFYTHIEWKDLRETRKSRHQDFILDALFSKMDADKNKTLPSDQIFKQYVKNVVDQLPLESKEKTAILAKVKNFDAIDDEKRKELNQMLKDLLTEDVREKLQKQFPKAVLISQDKAFDFFEQYYTLKTFHDKALELMTEQDGILVHPSQPMSLVQLKATVNAVVSNLVEN